LPAQPFSFILPADFEETMSTDNSVKNQPAAEPTPAPEPPVLESAALTPGQIAELQTQAAKANEHWERLLRATAEFDNFKKRAARERQDAIKFANESLLQKLLPVLDNFDAALTAAQTGKAETTQSLVTGVTMIQQQLRSTLIEAGLEEIEAAGKAFDPNLHEAVSQVETTEHPDGHVAQQLRRGYKLKERLLRPATVIVAKAPAAQ
jgi:molecular chaperone GrpE